MLNLNVMYVFCNIAVIPSTNTHTHTHAHTQNVILNASPVLLQTQPATSSPVGPGAGQGTVSTSEVHSVGDLNADVVSG